MTAFLWTMCRDVFKDSCQTEGLQQVCHCAGSDSPFPEYLRGRWSSMTSKLCTTGPGDPNLTFTKHDWQWQICFLLTWHQIQQIKGYQRRTDGRDLSEQMAVLCECSDAWQWWIFKLPQVESQISADVPDRSGPFAWAHWRATTCCRQRAKRPGAHFQQRGLIKSRHHGPGMSKGSNHFCVWGYPK